MMVNGLKLPEAFVRLFEAIHQEGAFAGFELKDDVDAYGNRFEVDLELWHRDLTGLTAAVASRFAGSSEAALEAAMKEVDAPPERVREVLAARRNLPGFIPLIDDFSKIVCFGESESTDPFCFDFRENPREPSVIYWDDEYWRRVAPDFKTFIGLYQVPANPRRPEDGETWTQTEAAIAKAKAALSMIETDSHRRHRRWPFGRQP